jgi:N-acetylglucosamine-6-phosphate deacetylase
LPGSLELIRECVAMGIICSIGHTIADAETISAAVRAGATCATHYGNAMGTFHQRAPGAIGELAIADEVMLEIVANEALLHPTVWSLARAAAGSERIILVSDNMPSAAIGKASEYYEFSGTIVRDDGDGVVTRVQDGRVWGNTRPMARLAAAYARETRCSLEELWQCTSANASRLLSLDEFGGLRPGQRGSIVVLDEICQLRATIIDGVVIHDAID